MNLPTLAVVLVIAGAGFGIVLVPVTTAVLSTVPAERSGMAASVTNTSRELGAVFGVAVLGALTNAQLNSSLTSQLKGLGIPADFQAIIFEAITQGASPSQGGAAAHANPGLAHLIDEVTNAAYTAFADGLHVALLTSTLLLVVATVVAATLVRRPLVLNTDLVPPATKTRPRSSRKTWADPPIPEPAGRGPARAPGGAARRRRAVPPPRSLLCGPRAADGDVIPSRRLREPGHVRHAARGKLAHRPAGGRNRPRPLGGRPRRCYG